MEIPASMSLSGARAGKWLVQKIRRAIQEPAQSWGRVCAGTAQADLAHFAFAPICRIRRGVASQDSRQCVRFSPGCTAVGKVRGKGGDSLSAQESGLEDLVHILVHT